MRRVVLTVAVAVLLVSAGCTYDDEEARADPGGGNESVPSGVSNETLADPPADRIGWENGVWYNESLATTPGDGLNDSELRAVVDRSMARVERVREREFERDVSVEVITREQFRDRNPFRFREDPLEEQTFEALFLVSEDTTVASARERLFGAAVGGYYSNGRIVLVSDNTSAVQVSPGVLAHELTHALQDQQFGFDYRRDATTDERNAYNALIEGEANYVEDRYLERCESEWDCLSRTNASGGSEYNRGLYLTVYAPYSEGPALIGDLVERADGWAAVDDAWERPPASTEQAIHPEKYPDEGPVEVTVEDRSSEDWRPVRGGRRSDAVGEAGVFAMLWANGVVPEGDLFNDSVGLNYSHPASAGWGGDRIRAYRNGEEYGYVWKTVWDTDRDAEQFRAAYRAVLENHGAVAVGDGRYRIDDGGFADAFRVVQDGTTVTVVNAPAVESLDDVQAPARRVGASDGD